MATTPLEKLQVAYRALDLFPLVSAESIDRYRVEYGREVLVRLEKEVEASDERGKFVFAGHRGCGKSTLLKTFAVNMKKKNNFVVFFSVADLIEMSDVSHINILYSIGIILLSHATRSKLSVPDDIKRELLGWIQGDSQIVLAKETETTTTGEVELDLGVLQEFLPSVNLKLQREQKFREDLQKNFEKRISDLVNTLDRLAATIKAGTKKNVLVVIDDLDKLDLSVVEGIYRQNIKALFAPNFRIVYTIPVSALQEPQIVGAINQEGSGKPKFFPVAKFFTRDDAQNRNGVPIERSIKVFEEILGKRFESGLLAPGIARKMVLASGGVLRELVRIGRECCTECMVQLEIDPDRENACIDDEILGIALDNLRNDFSRQVLGGYSALLVQVYKTLEPVEDEAFTKLLHGLLVLEYQNGDMWYDLHPLVAELLRRRKLVD